MAFEMYEMRLTYEMVCIPIFRIQDVFWPDPGRVRLSSSRIGAGSWIKGEEFSAAAK